MSLPFATLIMNSDFSYVVQFYKTCFEIGIRCLTGDQNPLLRQEIDTVSYQVSYMFNA